MNDSDLKQAEQVLLRNKRLERLNERLEGALGRSKRKASLDDTLLSARKELQEQKQRQQQKEATKNNQQRTDKGAMHYAGRT